MDGFGGRLSENDHDVISFAKKKTFEKCGLVVQTLDHVATICVEYSNSTWQVMMFLSHYFTGAEVETVSNPFK